MGSNIKLKKTPIVNLVGEIIGYEAAAKDIKIIECKKIEADEIITPHHYSKKVTKAACINLIVIFKGRPEGAIQIGYGIRPKIKGEMDPAGVREFERMWLSDNMPKFSETITISLLIHYLKQKHPYIKTLISYADTSAGMTGTIYKAANFKLMKTIKADFYILPTGERIHPVTMWHRHKTREWGFLQQQYPGIKRATGLQLQFVYNLK